MKHSVLAALLCLISITSSLRAQDDTAAKVFQKTNRAVVALRNIEGGGTGILLDNKGLILTNAHVISSPLPFKCTIDILKGRKPETVTYKKVKVVGVHPKKDLALVRINPDEHKGILQTAKIADKKAMPGQWVCAIGNPAAGDGMVLNKTITTGVLSGVDRKFEDVTYYQVDAAINPGNSGGPLLNRDSEVLGLVTLKFTNVDNVGFAIPLYDLKLADFVPLKKRKGDMKEFKRLVDAAHEYFDKSVEIGKRSGTDSFDYKMYRLKAATGFRMALAEDPGNASLYYNVGMILSDLDEHEIAAGYLLQSIELAPWGDDDGSAYHELGFALIRSEQNEEGEAAWREGIAKFPATAQRIYDDLAVYNFNEAKNYYEAAYNASVAIHLADPKSKRVEKTKSLLKDATDKLSDQDNKKLQLATARIENDLRVAKLRADKMKKGGQQFVTEVFTDYVENFGSISDEGEDETPTIARTDPGGGSDAEPETSDSGLDLTIPEGWTDLLSDIQPSSDSVRGTWKFTGKTLVSPMSMYSRLEVPAKLPEEYDLKMIVERKSNNKEFAIGFVRGGVQSAFLIDVNGNASSLKSDGSGGHRGAVFENGQPATIHCMVRREGLLVSVDGKRIFFEKSSAAFPRAPAQWAVDDKSKMFLGANMSKYYVHKLMLKPYERKR